MVLNPWNLDSLLKIKEIYEKEVYTILQLRYLKSIIELRNKIKKRKNKTFDVDLTYISSRGNWYYTSWKSDINKSGGVVTNIGIHFFDMLIWIFGNVKSNIVHSHSHDRASGYLSLKNANIRWFLSINPDTLPKNHRDKKTYRSIKIDNEEIEFSKNFTELHSLSYKNILNNKGYGITDAYPSIKLVHDIRNSKLSPLINDYHPLSKLKQSPHPFDFNL